METVSLEDKNPTTGQVANYDHKWVIDIETRNVIGHFNMATAQLIAREMEQEDDRELEK